MADLNCRDYSDPAADRHRILANRPVLVGTVPLLPSLSRVQLSQFNVPLFKCNAKSPENWAQNGRKVVSEGLKFKIFRGAFLLGKCIKMPNFPSMGPLGRSCPALYFSKVASMSSDTFLARLLILIKEGGLLQLKFVGVNIYLWAR